MKTRRWQNSYHALTWDFFKRNGSLLPTKLSFILPTETGLSLSATMALLLNVF